MSAPREIIPSPGRATNARKSFDQMVSMALRGGDFLFVCGLTAVDLQSGEAMRGTTAGETRQILTNLKPLLEAAGSSLDKVVKVNVLLYSMLEAPNMNEVYTRF
jgi:2-iminobutanoate/2-iminopropanoate deaminase